MRRIALLVLPALLFPFFYALAAGEVDLLWQGRTYTPPFYLGLPLWSNESRITLVALARVPGVEASALYYKWSKNGTVLGTSSGVNKRSLTFADSVLSLPAEIRVDVLRAQGEGIEASASVTLAPVASKLLVYEDSPLYGLMLHKAVLGEFSLSEPEVTFAAFPLYSTVTDRRASAMTYTWTTNSNEKRIGESITYRAPENSAGSSNVSLRAANIRVLTQPKVMSFLVKFDNTNDF